MFEKKDFKQKRCLKIKLINRCANFRRKCVNLNNFLNNYCISNTIYIYVDKGII